jgi:hypothetical protein
VGVYLRSWLLVLVGLEFDGSHAHDGSVMSFKVIYTAIEAIEAIEAIRGGLELCLGGYSQLLSSVEGQLAPSPPRGMTPLVRRLARRRKELRYALLSPQPIFPTSDECVNPVAISRVPPALAIVEADFRAATVKFSSVPCVWTLNPACPAFCCIFQLNIWSIHFFIRHGNTRACSTSRAVQQPVLLSTAPRLCRNH